jgi:hypothetical protein
MAIKAGNKFITPDTNAQTYYISTLLKGAVFVAKQDVIMDNQLLESGSNLDDKAFLYQALNRMFSNSVIRLMVLGEDAYWVSSTNDMTVKPAVAASPGVNMATGEKPVPATLAEPAQLARALLESARLISHEKDTDASDILLTGGMDGFFPWGCQNHTLRAMTGNVSENGFIKPNTEMSIVLQNRQPIDALFERTGIPDTIYFGGETATDNAPAITIDFKALHLTYQSVIVDRDDELADIKKSTCNYQVDVPILRMNNLLDGIKHEEKKINLPRNAKLMYLCFVYEAQFMLNKTKKTHLSPRFRLAPNLATMKVNLAGREGLGFKDGFRQLLTANIRNSESMRQWYRMMVREGYYTKDMSSFVPEKGHSYDNAFVFSLLSYKIVEGDELTVSLDYSDDLSKPGWHLFCFCVVPKILTCDANNKWTFKDEKYK